MFCRAPHGIHILFSNSTGLSPARTGFAPSDRLRHLRSLELWLLWRKTWEFVSIHASISPSPFDLRLAPADAFKPGACIQSHLFCFSLASRRTRPERCFSPRLCSQLKNGLFPLAPSLTSLSTSHPLCRSNANKMSQGKHSSAQPHLSL